MENLAPYLRGTALALPRVVSCAVVCVCRVCAARVVCASAVVCG